MPIDVEYEIQHSHIRLLVPDCLCASRQVSANKLVYETHPSRNTANKIPVYQYIKIYSISITLLLLTR